MKRCYVCHKIVWPWQPHYLGIPAAHRNCDYQQFLKDLYTLVYEGKYPPEQVQLQTTQRWYGAYSK